MACSGNAPLDEADIAPATRVERSTSWVSTLATDVLECVTNALCGSLQTPALEAAPMPVGDLSLSDAKPGVEEARLSPVSVTQLQAPDRSAAWARESALFFDGVQLLTKVYRKLLNENTWPLAYIRVAEQPFSHAPILFLGPCDVDGWNVLSGAIEVAKLWGFAEAGEDTEMSTITRLRMAVCLLVSYKWNVGADVWPRYAYPFRDVKGVNHTLEMAHVANMFLEGPYRWPTDVEELNVLQDLVIDLEGTLISSIALWSPLVENAQILTEDRLRELQSIEGAGGGLEDGWAVLLSHRAVVAFFFRVTLLPEHGLFAYWSASGTLAGAFVICAILAIQMNAVGHEIAMKQFTREERKLAGAIIEAAHNASHSRAGDWLWSGSFESSRSWPPAQAVSRIAIRRLFISTR